MNTPSARKATGNHPIRFCFPRSPVFIPAKLRIEFYFQSTPVSSYQYDLMSLASVKLGVEFALQCEALA